MNKYVTVMMVSLVLTGCDKPDALTPFSPEMASFSSEFNFDPLRGPVKNFTQKLINDSGEVETEVNGTLSQEGCFETLNYVDKPSNSHLALVLDANYYLDAVTREKRIRLQGKCQLAELPAVGMIYETNEREFVVKGHTNEVTTSYRYDDEGYPLGKTSKAKDAELSTVATPSDKRKKHDYTSVTKLNDKVIDTAKQSCDYDRHLNPLSCVLELTDTGTTPAKQHKFTIQNEINYY
ncbi:YnfC family lipoprotein [Cronobacter dublinensis]|uniref:YnfC family lipoprotein n=1 Tax=Cronobacter dublinensis TaxID=413497 RepID=UPI000CFDCC9D|nr:YnfC family lipoprotein [Cronobacter dublinensis]EKK7714013.1 YnfC family lipoprotein [Cronobacter dublinensis]